jgi:hypothetical protein
MQGQLTDGKTEAYPSSQLPVTLMTLYCQRLLSLLAIYLPQTTISALLFINSKLQT